jgi:predicted DNA binding CopG/RHH family protein
MVIDKKLPVFASDEEEAAWWDAHREETDTHMAEAIANGTAMNLQEFLFKEGLLIDVEPVTLPLLRDDLQIAKDQAASQGVGYEEYLSRLLHEALRSSQAV